MRYRPCKVPEHAHPLVRRLFVEMNAKRFSLFDLSCKSGVGYTTIQHWRDANQPSIAALEACFNAIGLTLTITPCEPS